MKLINFEKLGVELKSLVLRYSVELVVCVATFVFCRIGGEFDYTVWLMPIVFGVVFAANNIITSSKYRYIYYATALLIIPAVVVDAREFLGSSAYWFSILLSAIVMLLSKKDRSDSRIGENFANMAMSVVVAMTVFLLLWALIGAIVASTIYIFGIDVAVGDRAYGAACGLCGGSYDISLLSRCRSQHEGYTYAILRYPFQLHHKHSADSVYSHTVCVYDKDSAAVDAAGGRTCCNDYHILYCGICGVAAQQGFAQSLLPLVLSLFRLYLVAAVGAVLVGVEP